MKHLFIICFLSFADLAWCSYPDIRHSSGAGFAMVLDGTPAPILVDSAAPSGLHVVAGWFAEDLERLSGKKPAINIGNTIQLEGCVVAGVVGTGGVIDQLAESGKLDVSAIAGRPEASITATIDDPMPGVKQALIVAGSDKRGAMYGLLDISRAAGVSPWYWWADVPVERKSNLRVTKPTHVRTSPKVRYRGIFINDEAPALANWAHEKFGSCNSNFYVHVYELILRLRGNFLWPAMWGRSLFDDDPESQRLADELGIVLSTSHHEPMQRAHVEWQRYGEGRWDYARNSKTLKDFWRDGVRRMGNYESVVTLGMRGDGD